MKFFFLALALLMFASTPSFAASELDKGIEASLRGDKPAARKLLLPLAEKGNHTAIYRLGEQEVYTRGKSALKWLLPLAEKGNLMAQYFAAQACHYSRQFTCAVKWYRAAAENASPGEARAVDAAFTYSIFPDAPKTPPDPANWVKNLAQYSLAEMYYRGQGVPPSTREAIRWMMKTALNKQGSKRKVALLYAVGGPDMKPDYVEAAYWMMRSKEQEGMVLAAHHLTPAQMEAVRRRVAAWKPVHAAYPRDKATEEFDKFTRNFYSPGPDEWRQWLKWLLPLAKKGNARAQSEVGNTYFGYINVDKRDRSEEYREALKWYRKAADQGYAPAMQSIAMSYEVGAGVKEDLDEALRWYRKALACPPSEWTANIMQNMATVFFLNQRNYEEGFRLMRAAASLDKTPGIKSALAKLYLENHPGFSPNYEEAVFWRLLELRYYHSREQREQETAAFLASHHLTDAQIASIRRRLLADRPFAALNG